MSEDDELNLPTTSLFSTLPSYTDGPRQVVLLDDVVKAYIDFAKDAKHLPGWHLLSRFQIKNMVVDGVKLPIISEEKAGELVDLAQSDCYAYDLAAFIAGLHIAEVCYAEQNFLPPVLYTFSAEVLRGEMKRPPQKGRPLSPDSTLCAVAYGLSKSISETSNLDLTRNPSQKNDSYSACDVVAESFTKAGHRMTYERLKSICHDDGHARKRQLAEDLKLLNFHFLKGPN